MKKLLAILLSLSILPSETWAFSAPTTALSTEQAPRGIFTSQALLLPENLERHPLHVKAASALRRFLVLGVSGITTFSEASGQALPSKVPSVSVMAPEPSLEQLYMLPAAQHPTLAIHRFYIEGGLPIAPPKMIVDLFPHWSYLRTLQEVKDVLSLLNDYTPSNSLDQNTMAHLSITKTDHSVTLSFVSTLRPEELSAKSEPIIQFNKTGNTLWNSFEYQTVTSRSGEWSVYYVNANTLAVSNGIAVFRLSRGASGVTITSLRTTGPLKAESVKHANAAVHSSSAKPTRRTPSRAVKSTSGKADLLGFFVHPERWGDSTQLLWALGSAFTEELIFRWGWIGDPSQIFDGTFDTLLPGLAWMAGSAFVFALLHPVLKWVARAMTIEVSPFSMLYWKSLWRALGREAINMRKYFSRSYVFPSILFTAIYVNVALMTTPVVGLIFVTLIHLGYNELLDKNQAKDPIPSRGKGQQAQMELLETIAGHLQDDRWRTSFAAMGDGDKFGDNNRFGKLAIGILGNPESSDLFIYNKSLFLEMREKQMHSFKAQGLDLYRGVGGDELEPVLKGDPDDVQRKMSAIVRDYADFYHARYGVYEVGPNFNPALTHELFAGLKKMPGVVVHLRHGDAGTPGQEGYTIVVDRAEFLRKIKGSDRTIQGYFNRSFGPAFDIQEILLRNETQSTFTVTFGALSWGDVLRKALEAQGGKEFWLENGRDGLRLDRLDAFYKFGTELANQVLAVAKNAGRNQALVARWDLINTLPLPAIEKGDAKTRLPIPWQVKLYQDGIKLNPMSYGALRAEYTRHPSDYLYHVTVSNWIDGDQSPVALRALHALNEKAGYSRADLVIEAFSEVVPGLFPPGASVNMARSGDSFVITSETKLETIMNFFKPYFEETLERKLKEKSGGVLSDDDRKFLRQINPFLIIYRTSLEELKAARQNSTLSSAGTENPQQLLDLMSSADYIYDMNATAVSDSVYVEGSVLDGERRLINLEKLKESLDVKIDNSKRYAMVSLDAKKSAKLSETYRGMQQAQREAAKASFAKYLGGAPISIDALPEPTEDDFSDRPVLSGAFTDFIHELKNLPSTYASSSLGKTVKRLVGRTGVVLQSPLIDVGETLHRMDGLVLHLNAQTVVATLTELTAFATSHPRRIPVGEHALSLIEVHATHVLDHVVAHRSSLEMSEITIDLKPGAYLAIAPQVIGILAQSTLSVSDARVLTAYGKALLDHTHLLRNSLRINSSPRNRLWEDDYKPLLKRFLPFIVLGVIGYFYVTSSTVAGVEWGVMIPLGLKSIWNRMKVWVGADNRTVSDVFTPPAPPPYKNFSNTLRLQFNDADHVQAMTSEVSLSDIDTVLKHGASALDTLETMVTDNGLSITTFRESLEDQLVTSAPGDLQIGMFTFPMVQAKAFAAKIKDGGFPDRYQAYILKHLQNLVVPSKFTANRVAFENGRIFISGKSPDEFNTIVRTAIAAATKEWLDEKKSNPNELLKRSAWLPTLDGPQGLQYFLSHRTLSASQIPDRRPVVDSQFQSKSPNEVDLIINPVDRFTYEQAWMTHRETKTKQQLYDFARVRDKDRAAAAALAEQLIIGKMEDLVGAAEVVEKVDFKLKNDIRTVAQQKNFYPGLSVVFDDKTMAALRQKLAMEHAHSALEQTLNPAWADESAFLNCFYTGLAKSVPALNYQSNRLPRRARLLSGPDDQMRFMKMAFTRMTRMGSSVTRQEKEAFVQEFKKRYQAFDADLMKAEVYATRNPRNDVIYNVRSIDDVLEANDQGLWSTLKNRLLDQENRLMMQVDSDLPQDKKERLALELGVAASLIDLTVFVYKRPWGDEIGVAVKRDHGYQTGLLELTNLNASYLRFPADPTDARLHSVQNLVLATVSENPRQSLVKSFKQIKNIMRANETQSFEVTAKIKVVDETSRQDSDANSEEQTKRLFVEESRHPSSLGWHLASFQGHYFVRVRGLFNRWISIAPEQYPLPADTRAVTGTVGATAIVHWRLRQAGELRDAFSHDEARIIQQKSISDWSERVRYDIVVAVAHTLIHSPPVRLWTALSDDLIRLRLPRVRTSLPLIVSGLGLFGTHSHPYDLSAPHHRTDTAA